MLENHSKRNNVRLVGLKEKYGTNGTLERCVKKVLSEGLGIDMEGEFEIERAHRILAPMPSEDQPPRPVLIRFLRQSAREKVLRAARERRGIEWEDAIMLCTGPDKWTTNQELGNVWTNLKTIWEKDIGAVIGDEDWKNILSNAGMDCGVQHYFNKMKITHSSMIHDVKPPERKESQHQNGRAPA
ncbi:LINE-1 type transposase domain-containing protein 1 [Anabarilius grahami]|uniref:LINE-1 type transposase domain-containing protein 1 n=1 Tax=Anabarilius grahami TaxID=495550 RepID=A0A3N0XU75_ANAGA|nr:LINE-1 type transposase domain-containing protein 1 [Anabarilius grahami]